MEVIQKIPVNLDQRAEELAKIALTATKSSANSPNWDYDYGGGGFYIELERMFLKDHPDFQHPRVGFTCTSDRDIRNYYEQRKYCQDCVGIENCRYEGYMLVPTYDEKPENVIVFRSARCASSKRANNEIRLARAFERSGLPKRYLAKRMTDFDGSGNSTALMGVKEFVTNKRSLYLYGGVGTGKTLLASLVGRACLQNNRIVCFYDLPTLTQKLKTALNGAAESESLESIHRRLAEVDVLILDDIGAEYRSAWVLEQLFIIVNERYNNERQILVTSNLSLEDLHKFWSKTDCVAADRMISRLSEVCIVAQMYGADRRRA